MLEGTSIVCLSQDWRGDPTSKTHIMRILARSNRVLWINSIGMRRPRFSAFDLRRAAGKLLRGLGGSREVEPNLIVTDPLVLPWHDRDWIGRVNAFLLAANIRSLCRRHHLERPILWSFLPHADHLIGRFGERLVVYHCVDEYSEFSGVPKEALQTMERHLVRRADVVFTSAEGLRAERLALNANTHFVPHGVDFAHFSRALDPAMEVPAELLRIPRPVVGFIGLVADWVDLDLIRSMASSQPGWSIVLIGKVVTDTAPLRGLPNVHLLGRRPYDSLPAYCRGLDVGIIPFRINRLTLQVNPLKLREYLAAGLPVVSTPLPEVNRYSPPVRVAADPPAFARAVDAALRERSPEGDRERSEAMRKASWESRVERISAVVEEGLRRAGPRPGGAVLGPATRHWRRWALSTAVALALAGGWARAAAPEPPRARVSVERPESVGRTLEVRAGGDLQAALDTARPGDSIRLQPGATFRGPFLLPAKSGSGWIVVRSAAPDERLPTPERRVDPSYRPLLPKLVASSGAVITAVPGAHHYRFVAVEIAPTEGTFLYQLVSLGGEERSAALQPRAIIFDRCYLHGDPEKGTRRGIALNGRELAVVGSWLSDFKEAGADSQAILGWNGIGPFRITGNYLEAAGENVMFGSVDPSIQGLVPSDIEVRGNVFAKPLAWKAGEESFSGRRWTIKNLFELKSARRVLVEENLFEFNWADAQNGFAILFTVRNQDGGAPWSSIEDVTFRGNVVRHAGGGVNILGRDDNHPSGPAQRILIRDNLFLDLDGARWGGPGTLLQVLNGAADVMFEHNTALQKGNILLADGAPSSGFRFTDNIVPHNAYGITGTGTGVGLGTLRAYFPGAVVTGNFIAGGDPALYPSGNVFPKSVEEIGFVDLQGGDPRLALTGRFRRAGRQGSVPGADPEALRRALALAASRQAPAGDAPEAKGGDR